MKKFSILFLLLAIFVAMTVLVSCNSETPTDEDCFIFYPLDDGTYAVECDSTLVQYLTKIVIPENHKGKKVSTIVNRAFFGCDNVKTIVIPNSVTTIGDYAFYECSNLTSVEIPNSVTSIGSWAFEKCSNLTSIVIPNSVTSIGSWAFDGCSNLTSIVIPNSVTSISYYAFSSCSNLTIYCEAESKPSGWDYYWNYSGCPVVWGHKK